MKISTEAKTGLLIAFLALVIALLTWLFPFEPIGKSPFIPPSILKATEFRVFISTPTDVMINTLLPATLAPATQALIDLPAPKYNQGQTLKVQVLNGNKSNTWTEPDVTIGVRFQTVPEGTLVQIMDEPAWGPARVDKSIYGWWYPILFDGRKVWIIEDNLQIP